MCGLEKRIEVIRWQEFPLNFEKNLEGYSVPGMKTFLTQSWGLLTAPVLSFYGYFLLKRISKKREPIAWRNDFCGKKVLIVGTGPSLDLIDEHFFSRYDVCVLINHAVTYSDCIENVYFFSTDIGVAQRLLHSKYWKNVLRIGADKCIIAPIFLQQVPGLSSDFRRAFSWIEPSVVRWRVRLLRLPVISKVIRIIPSLPIYVPNDVSLDELEKWNSTSCQLNYFPVCASTSALSAILLCAKYKPDSIDMIGCDFSGGRMSALKSEIGVSSDQAFSGAIDKFHFVRDYLKQVGVTVENKSWIL